MAAYTSFRGEGEDSKDGRTPAMYNTVHKFFPADQKSMVCLRLQDMYTRTSLASFFSPNMSMNLCVIGNRRNTRFACF